MDILQKTRELGAAIQNDARYRAYAAAKKANDENAALQEQIGAFNLVRLSIDRALSADERDDAEIQRLNERMRTLYADIMATPGMVAYNDAKTALDALMEDVQSILTLCANGDDPETCEPSRCTGSCATCGGCA